MNCTIEQIAQSGFTFWFLVFFGFVHGLCFGVMLERYFFYAWRLKVATKFYDWVAGKIKRMAGGSQ